MKYFSFSTYFEQYVIDSTYPIIFKISNFDDLLNIR